VRFEVAATGRVERTTLRVGPLEGELDVAIGLDVPRLHDDLQTMLAGGTLSGTTSIESIEHDFRLHVSIKQGKGVIQGEVTEQFATNGGLTFRLITDQSFLRATLEQVDALLRDVTNSS